jgi:hypothetical protein
MLTLSGALGRLYLGDLLEWLHLTHATGRLLLSAGDVTRAFDMNRGKVAFVASSRASERLGSWLLREGVAPREVLMRALVVSQTQGELFTTVLKRESGIDPARLTEAGRSLATTLASRVLREEQVTFTFDPTWPVKERNEVDLDLDCRNLIMQAAYRVDTRPAGVQTQIAPNTTLDPNRLEALFWHITQELEGELLRPLRSPRPTVLFSRGRSPAPVGCPGPTPAARWARDAERIMRRLKAGKQPRLETPDPRVNLLCLVNG